jgi:hypothetical protein
MSKLKELVVEMHRRSLWQVLLICVGAAWACFELIDTVAERLGHQQHAVDLARDKGWLGVRSGKTGA